MKIVVASGYFNPLHKGHVEYLEKELTSPDEDIKSYTNECEYKYEENVNIMVNKKDCPMKLVSIIRKNDNYMLEFTIENNVALSEDDFHLNATGHQLWADHLIKQINQDQ